jgi:hypothetical protein
MTTLQELTDSAIEELKEWMRENPDASQNEADEAISEIADGSVPVYNATLLDAALDELWLATTEPELYAFDGTPTAVNAIAGNIYQHIEEELGQYFSDNQDALEEDDDPMPLVDAQEAN